MQTQPLSSRPVLSQAKNNTTLWIGHLKTDPIDHIAGQTFTCPTEGVMDNIQLYASAVQCPGDIQLSLHEFDVKSKTWGPAIAEANLEVEKADQQKWIRFGLPALPLKKESHYGFRLHTKNSMIGLGEASSGNQSPFSFGHEWSADSKDQYGYYYSYFSLTFKIEMRA